MVIHLTVASAKMKYPKPLPPVDSMRVIVNTDNEAEIWKGNKKVGYVDNGGLYAIVEYNAHSEAQYVGEPGGRGEIVPMLRKYFEQEGCTV